jgi:hypothetical protein
MKRPHPAKLPQPQVRPGEILYDLRHDPGHHIRGRPAAFLDQRHVEGALLVFAPPGLVDGGKARRFEEACDGGFGRIDARALFLLAHDGRTRRQSLDDSHETAWRGEGLELLVFEAGAHERCPKQAREVRARARLHARRDLLGEQFEQKLSHGAASLV